VAVGYGLKDALIVPDWSAPAHVHAFTTSRFGGVSTGSAGSLNLADHVGDDPHAVARNRARLARALELPAEPSWLNQVHSSSVVCADDIGKPGVPVEADAAWTVTAGTVCAVLTADCLPLLLCDRDGRQVAAVHAGWRGMCAGIIELAVDRFFAADIPAHRMLAWLGPAIGQASYEIDGSVRDAFLGRNPDFRPCFMPSRPGHWHFDLYAAARTILESVGVQEISGGNHCTYSDERLFSYRRNSQCGRQASLIWADARQAA
jgi:YfiH family protein